MSKQLELSEVVKQVRKIAAENPDYVYFSSLGDGPSCVYVDREGNGSCLIGRGLIAAGVSADDLHAYDDGGGTSAFVVLADFFGETSEPAKSIIDWLNIVQVSQDTGCPWGECIQDADEMYPNIWDAGAFYEDTK